MLHQFQRHRRWVLIVLIAAVGVSMLFFGVPLLGENAKNNRNADVTLATVGGVPIKQSEYLGNLDAMANRQQTKGKGRTPYADLAKDGTADKVLDNMVESALITMQTKDRKFEVDKQFLEDQMKKWETFQNSDGKYDPAAWNKWVEEQERHGTDWNKLFTSVGEQMARSIYMKTILAPAARVIDADIDEQLNENYTKLKVKYAAVEAPIDVTNEQLKAYYDKAPKDFKEPDALVAEFVALSLKPEMPAELTETLAKLRAPGADFAAIVKESSDGNKDNGGDIGWQSEPEVVPDYRKPLFALKAGEVSEPVALASGFFIYKVDEERTNDKGKREVKARQYYKKAALSEEEKKARKARMAAVKDKANELKDLAKAAEAEKLSVQRTPEFTKDSKDIAGISAMDRSSFAKALDAADASAQYVTVDAQDNSYVAKVVERKEGRVPAFEEVVEKVREAYVKDEKKKQAYLDRVKEYVEKIKAQAKNLGDAAAKFPELKLTIAETEAFNKKAFFVNGINAQAVQIFDAFKGKEPGTLAGPVESMFGDKKPFMIELAERTPPTDEDKKKFDEERKQLRDGQINQAERKLLEDYVADLRERTLPTVSVKIDQARINALLGVTEEDKNAPPAEAKDGAEPTGAAASTPKVEVKTEGGSATTPAIKVETKPATPAPAPAAPAAPAPAAPAPAPAAPAAPAPAPAAQ